MTGEGTLDSQADKGPWHDWKGKGGGDLVKMGNNDVPVKDRVFGEGKQLRPYFFQPTRCISPDSSDASTFEHDISLDVQVAAWVERSHVTDDDEFGGGVHGGG